VSDELSAPAGIRLGAYCGPDDEGPDRQRWQIETDGIVVMTRGDVYWLMSSLSGSLHGPPPPPAHLNLPSSPHQA
jgi:hypothetical protein